MVEEESKTQKKFSLDAQTVTATFKGFFSFSGEVSRSEFAQRIIYVAGAAFISIFWFAIPFLHSLILVGTIASLASLVVRRLRNLNYHWAFVFLGLIPFIGWVVLAVFAVLKPRSQDDDGLPVAKIALSAGATFIASALLVTSLSINAGANSEDNAETSQSVEETVVDQEQIAAEEAAEAEEQAALEEEEQSRLAEEAAEAEKEAEEQAAAEAEKEAEEQAAAEASAASFEELIAGLTIQPEVAGGYDRDLFRHWIDADGDGCDTRREVLIAESTTPVSVGSGCSLNGGTWVSAFDGVSTTDASKFDVDHFVPLAEAWRSGAHSWDSSTRQNFANDLGYEMSLIAVSASTNRTKSDRDPSKWMPPSSSFKCEYVYSWIQVKTRWKLTVDSAEANALRSNWSGCSVEELDFSAKASGARIGTAPAPAPETNSQESAQPAPSAPEPELSGCVNINTASFDELQQIIHIGPTRANELISLRPFSSLNDMGRINGIKVGGVRLNEIKAQGLACVG